MRRFRLLSALAVTVLALLGPAHAAAAQEGDLGEGTEEGNEGGSEIGHAEEECIHLLEEGGTIDDCQEAPNPILPETNEIIWGAVGFFIVLGFLWRFGYPAVKKGMEARADRIRSDLDAAESQRSEAEQVLSEYRAQLADARSESARIIEEARQSADSMRRDLAAQAETDIADMRRKAAAEIESAKTQAIADLRNEVANLAIAAAERVVERSLDRETNTALVESFISQVGSDR